MPAHGAHTVAADIQIRTRMIRINCVFLLQLTAIIFFFIFVRWGARWGDRSICWYNLMMKSVSIIIENYTSGEEIGFANIGECPPKNNLSTYLYMKSLYYVPQISISIKFYFLARFFQRFSRFLFPSIR